MDIDDSGIEKQPHTLHHIQPQTAISGMKLLDEDSFRKSFLIPKMNASKTKKKNLKQRQSTVITSEAWKRSEHEKLEEKQRLEAAKEARKVQREEKKMLKAQLKVEKKMEVERKKIVKAEKEALKKKKKVCKKNGSK